MGRGDLGGIDLVVVTGNLDSGNDVLQVASASSTSGAAALSLQGPVVVADTGRSTKTAGSADSLLVVERAASAASADTVGLDVLSATKARGTLSLYAMKDGGKQKSNKNVSISSIFSSVSLNLL